MQALQYFQEQGFVHGNINATTICLSEDAITPNVKINIYDFAIGSERYQATDIRSIGKLLKDHIYDREVD